MRRRNFIRGLAATAAWPVAGRAQQPERVRRIGVLQPGARDDPENRLRLTTFQQALQGLGWTDGRNVHIETIFFVTSDSVQEGLVASLNKPGGNITGVDIMSGELTGKRLELIARLVSSSRPVAFLANTSGQRSSSRAKDFEGAARSLSRSFIVVDASDDAELESIFSKLAENKVGGVVVEND